MCFLVLALSVASFFFFFNDPATTEIYTLSLHDALPIFRHEEHAQHDASCRWIVLQSDLFALVGIDGYAFKDRKSTRLNSSHQIISYAVFCLKKKKKQNNESVE